MDHERSHAISSSAKILAIIPARNEELSIAKTIEGVKGELPQIDILVISDGSTDSTETIASRTGANVIRLPFRLGYGGAVQAGFKYAHALGYDFVLQMDADGQHDPASARALLAPVVASEVDIAIGSRFRGELRYRIPWLRRAGMRFFARILKIVTGREFTDPTSGYQAMNRGVFGYFAAGNYPSDFPDADTIIALTLAGFRISEVPVTMLPRTAGSSMHSNLRAGYYVAKMTLAILMVLLRGRVAPRGEPAPPSSVSDLTHRPEPFERSSK